MYSKYKNLILCFIWLIIIINIKCEEELCPLTRDESKPSCGENSEIPQNENSKNENQVDDLIIEDDSSQESQATCGTGNEKTCGGDIKFDPNSQKTHHQHSETKAKTDYLAKKKKNQSRKPEEPAIVYPEKFKHEEAFLQKGHEREEYLKSFNGSNYTNYFDFSIDQEELDYVKQQKYAIYPAKKFQFNNQGNFLHFYKVAYEKKLPVLFTTDSMLYALNENINRVMTNFIENVFIVTLKSFFEKLVNYIETLKENPDLEEHKLILSQAQIFYGANAHMLSDGIHEYEGPQDVDPFIKGMSALAKKFTTNNFGVMMKARAINTKSLLPIGIWRRSRRMGNTHICLQWLKLIKFDLRDDMKTIFILGKIIVDSGNKEIFNEIREIIHYLIGEDKNAPNWVEVYELGLELGLGDVYVLSDTQLHDVNMKVVDLVSRGNTYKSDLRFTNDYFLYSQEALDKFKYDKEYTSGLIGKYSSIEDWVANKLIGQVNGAPRLMYSSWELVDAIHHASSYRDWIFNRYKGKPTVRNEQMMPFRDSVDLQEHFEKAKYSIKHSMEKEPENWKKNMNNHYHYLLYKLTRRIKHSKDPIFKHDLFKEKVFYTSWGAYTHFQRHMILMTLRCSIEAPKTEDYGLPEVHIEPHLEFYKEMDKFWNLFKDKILNFTFRAEPFIEINFKNIRSQFQNSFNDMNYAIQLVIQGILKQESGTMTEDLRESLNKLIYFDKEINKWAGWYVNVHDKDKPETIFNYDIWVSSVANFHEAEQMKFGGASLFDIMRFPNIALIVVEDKYEKVRKIMLSAGYNVKDSYRPIKEKPDVEEVSKMVMDRN